MRWLVCFLLAAPAFSGESGPAPAHIRKAVERALPPLERSAGAFVAKRACVSCHHNTLTVLVLRSAQQRGFETNPEIVKAVESKTFQSLVGPAAFDEAVQAKTLSDPTPEDSLLLMAANAAGINPSLTTAIIARRLVRWQRDGHWVTSDFRPPHSSSLFTATATAVRAISLYMPDSLRSERDDCVHRAREWLARTHPLSTEDAAFRLMGLVWAGAGVAELEAARRDLLALRKPGSGWPELPGYPADAYSTGESLYALHDAGAVSGEAWRDGIGFLLSTQAPDGSWHVRTRMLSPAEVSPKYFTTGFPYQKDEYISYAGSCWAVMALLSALPQTPLHDGNNTTIAAQEDPPAWAQTALFGTAEELRKLLDAGLDPNIRTAHGTALLAVAAPDADKVQLLLERGAKAPGSDAVTVAASYRGTANSIEALIGAGAEVKSAALVLASMAGDIENVKLLLRHGADPNAPAKGNTPLTAALTFGYPEVARVLIEAGASVDGTESSGINLMHWAVITDRPAVIPVLADAGVPINATDHFGFTPLMYAATIDFGDTQLVSALLKAGANLAIRNGAGRTAKEQARYYGHKKLERALP